MVLAGPPPPRRQAGVLLHKHNARDDYPVGGRWPGLLCPVYSQALVNPLLQTGQAMPSWGCVEARVGCAAVGRRNVGLPFPVGQCVGCHHKCWASEVLLGPQGKDRIFRKANFSLARHFHSEGGQLFSRATRRKKLLQLL